MPRRRKGGPESRTALQRIGIALGHRYRVAILNSLAIGEGSATSLSREIPGATVGDVSYHLGVLDDDCLMVELVRSRPVRGAEEHFFRLRLDTDLKRIRLPEVVTHHLRAAIFRLFADAVVAAIEAGTLSDQDSSTFEAEPLTVDQEGAHEIHATMREAMRQVKRTEGESLERLRQKKFKDSISLLVGAASFRIANKTNSAPAEL